MKLEVVSGRKAYLENLTLFISSLMKRITAIIIMVTLFAIKYPRHFDFLPSRLNNLKDI